MENTTDTIQVFMWAISGGLAIIFGVLSIICHRLFKLSDKISDIDKRLYGVETLLHMKDCCVLKQDQNLRKAE